MAKTTILSQVNTLTRAINFASVRPVRSINEDELKLIYNDLAFVQAHASRKAINKAKPLRFVCDDERVAERFSSKIFYTDITSQILESYLFGINVFELNWELKDGYFFPELVQRDFRDFAFMPSGELGFCGDYGTPVAIPDGKVVYALYEPNFSLKYGDALLPKLLKIIKLKNATVQFWAEFQEKFGSPWAVAKTDSAPEELAREVHSMLSGDTAVIDTEEDISLIQPSSQSGDFKELIAFLDNAIRSVILGGNLSSEVEAGSFAAAAVHEGVRQDIAAADLANLLFVANKTCEHFKRVNNYAGELYCELEPVSDIKMELAQRDAVIAGMGFELSPEYIAETYGVEVTKRETPSWGNDGFLSQTAAGNSCANGVLNGVLNSPLNGVLNTQPPGGQMAVTGNFSSNSTPTPRDEIDAALESEEFARLAEEIEKHYAAEFEALLKNSKSYEEAATAAADLELTNDKLETHLTNALAASTLKGEADALE